MADSIKEETPTSALGSDAEFDAELVRKRKSKSPGIFHEAKRAKESEDIDLSEDIAKQFKKFKAAPKYNFYSEEVYCVCRKPDHGGELMVGCDGCEEWFHFKCMKLNVKNQKLIDSFFCKFCQWQGFGTTKWHRKCRLASCHNPILKNEKSKYCSEECGLQYFKSRLTGSDVLTQNDIRVVLTKCSGHDDLTRMGQEFPELPEVRLLDMDKLPGDIRQDLTDSDTKKQSINDILELAERRSEFLVQIKEKVRLINEKLQLKLEPSGDSDEVKKSKKKKTKLRKVDLCCFDRKLSEDSMIAEYDRVLGLESVYEAFKDEIDEVVEHYDGDGSADYTGSMCLSDRRKCLRHNGWLSLLTDQVWKRKSELELLLERLDQHKADTLRDYSIQKYEECVV